MEKIIVNWDTVECRMKACGIHGVKDLAKRLGVHYVTVNRMRNGSKLPHRKTLNRLCQVLGLGPESLVGLKVPRATKAELWTQYS